MGEADSGCRGTFVEPNVVTRQAEGLRRESRARDRVDVHGLAVHGVRVGSLETLTDLCGNSNRAEIVGCDKADDAVDVSRREQPNTDRRC